MGRTSIPLGGKRTVIVGVAVAMFASAGVAAAATGGAPWSSDVPASEESTSSVAVTDGIADPAVSVSTGDTETATSDPTVTDPPVTDSTDPVVTDGLPADTTTPATSWVPPTSPPGDTQVPLGITLDCAQDGSTVTCTWSGVQLAGFTEFLLLRGDGTVGRVPYRTSDPSGGTYIDAGLKPGSYSYVVVAIDSNSKALVHSNGVHIEIATAG